MDSNKKLATGFFLPENLQKTITTASTGLNVVTLPSLVGGEVGRVSKIENLTVVSFKSGPTTASAGTTEAWFRVSLKIPDKWVTAPWDAGSMCSTNAVRDIVLALLAGRDFLGHQLSHATGLLDDAEFERIADEFFDHIGLESDDALESRAFLLFELLHERLDTDITAAALRCDFEQAERILRRVAVMVGEPTSRLALKGGSDDP